MQELYRVTNTALDYSKDLLHRRAAKMVMEPTIAGQRLRLRSSLLLTARQMEANKDFLRELQEKGTVSVSRVIPVDFVNAKTELSPQGETVVVEEAAPQVEPEKPLVIVDDVGLPEVTATITAEKPRAGDPPAPPVVEAPVAAAPQPARQTPPVPTMNQKGFQPPKKR